MREAIGFIATILSWQWRSGSNRNAQGANETRKKLKGSRHGGQFHDLKIVVDGSDLTVKIIVDFRRRAMQTVGIAKTDFLGAVERTMLEILQGGDLLLASTLLLRGKRVRPNPVLHLLHQVDANCNEF